jgi:hypothetical protein
MDDMDIIHDPQALIKELLAHQRFMEEICMITRTTRDDADEQLVDYALHRGQKGDYPMTRRQAHDGFHLWLRRSMRYRNEKIKKDDKPRGLVI